MTKKKEAPAKAKLPALKVAPATVSKMKPGKGSTRIKRRVIFIYGPAKTRKTTTLSTLPPGRTKWIVSDPNTIPTLTALDRLPAADDIYEVKSLKDVLDIFNDILDVVDANPNDVEGALGFQHLVIDSLTTLSDWHQADVAEESGQRWLGDDMKNNGWQQFNVQFGSLLDRAVNLSAYMNVYMVGHAKEKPADGKKGDWASLNLTPQMAQKAGRLCNWILFKMYAILPDVEPYNTEIPGIRHSREVNGITEWVEDAVYTQPVNGFIASANLRLENRDQLCWPADITKLLEAEDLL